MIIASVDHKTMLLIFNLLMIMVFKVCFEFLHTAKLLRAKAFMVLVFEPPTKAFQYEYAKRFSFLLNQPQNIFCEWRFYLDKLRFLVLSVSLMKGYYTMGNLMSKTRFVNCV